MMRRLLILNGLAIIAVVCNHASGWGLTAMFWWVNLYRPVSSPNFSQYGSLPHLCLIAVKQLTLFSVPAFLFTSGYFVAYAVRGEQNQLSWKMVRIRISKLMVPYLIWSILIFIGDFLIHQVYSFKEYIWMLLSGGADIAYYYVIALVLLFLLSPLIVPLVKTRWIETLLISFIIQFGIIGLKNVIILGYKAPSWFQSILISDLFPGRYILYFTLGMVMCLQFQTIKRLLMDYKIIILISTFIMGSFAIISSEEFQTLLNGSLFGLNLIFSSLYALLFISGFLTFENVSFPLSKQLMEIGSKSFGIYLIHGEVLKFISKVIYHTLPFIFTHQLLYQVILISLSIILPIGMMKLIIKSPVRWSYNYLFG
jgi:probable poly-beta-1,6-N-acetyl-D-glucosamine export protein